MKKGYFTRFEKGLWLGSVLASPSLLFSVRGRTVHDACGIADRGDITDFCGKT